MINFDQAHEQSDAENAEIDSDIVHIITELEVFQPHQQQAKSACPRASAIQQEARK